MDIFKSYIKDHRRLLLALPVLGASAAMIFYLYSLPLGAVIYSAVVIFILALCFFIIPDYVRYWRKAQRLRELKENILTQLEASPNGQTLHETLLYDIVSLLCSHIRELEDLHSRKYNDMLEYYTLWVHQVKTPLSAMDLILQAKQLDEGDALRQELFKIERYVELVLGYLRMYTLSSDLRLESYSIHEIVRRAIKKFAPQFIYQKLSLNLMDFDNKVITDEKWLQFVLEQLLSNALKYTEQGGVTIRMDKNDVLYIEDTGIGISQEDIPRIFERGFTGYNGRMNKGSSGIGLFLSKSVLQRLHHRIEIDSTPGSGTQVRLYLHRAFIPDE